MTTTFNKYKDNSNNVDITHLMESHNVIIVHPNQHIIAKIVKHLEKTR